MARTLMSRIDTLEPRRLMADTTLDSGFHFSESAIDAAAGRHLTIDSIVDASAGRTLMLARTPVIKNQRRLILVEIDSNGGLNKAFSGDGLADTGIDVGPNTGTSLVRVSSDAYIDVLTINAITRFRADGARDHSFDGGHGVDYTGGVKSYRTLDVQANVNGGIDVLRSIDRDLGRTFTNAYHIQEELFDSVVQLIHVTADGSAMQVWEKVARQNTIADNVYLDYDLGSVTALAGGGWVVLAARQQNIDNIDSAFGQDIVGDTFVDFIAADGATMNEKMFNTGTETALADVRVQGNGSRVRFTYGGRREVELTNQTRIRRYNLAIGPMTPGLNEQVLAINGTRFPYNLPYPFTAAKGLTVSLRNTDGAFVSVFGESGEYALSGVTGKYPGPFTVISAQPGSALISWRNDDAAESTSIVRLWLGPQPTATLTAAVVRGRTATVTVQYRAQPGVAAATVNSHDIVLTSKRGQTALRLISKAVVGDTVIATYRAVDLLRGAYFADVLPNQIGSGSDAFNEAQRLGQFAIA